MRKSKCIVIISMLICSLCICVYAETITPENIIGLQEQSNELTEQLNETNNRLQAVQEDISKNMQQLQEVDAQIIQSQDELNIINIQNYIPSNSDEIRRKTIEKFVIECAASSKGDGCLIMKKEGSDLQ